MFKEVPTKVNFPQMEERILRFWQENGIFEKSLEMRKDASCYVFYEGPPTANGKPGTHHVLARIFKDLFPRYKTMRGYYVLRKGGWDCHGLPVELEIEEELGLSSKKEIEGYGIAEFNRRCKESVFRYVKEWEDLTDRIGFWIDMEHPYVTLTNDYIESVWWILKQLWEKDLIYQGYKVVPYCPRCGTPLSDHELHYPGARRETDDPSIYVKFPLRDEPGTYFLVWTTTPWTLPGNAALAVHPDVRYALVEQDGEKLILAEELLHEVLEGEYEIIRDLSAKELVGKHYRPLFTFLPVDRDYCYVLAADFVTTEEGTGIVHIAPAFGAEDLEVGKEHDLPILHTVNLEGAFIDKVTPWRGLFVKNADPLIIEDLKSRELMYRVGIYRHVYPFCWRCDTPLLYYAKTSWFIETTRYRDELLANNQKINWYPGHIKDGRFGNWLEGNVDWALGRERYWGTPLPVWVCEECGKQEYIGSVEELKSKVQGSKSKVNESSGLGLRTWDLGQLDLHRPYIDEITYRCPECSGVMHRVLEVIDAWFDSGAMPVAQWRYPFENRDLFREQFPADFICEAVDQTRGWFYSLHAISTLLFDQPCYRNVICLGLILDQEGEKMSKSKGNVVDPWEVIDAQGADALRWYLYTASPPGQSRRFSVELVGEVVRKFLLTLWNVYSFFVTYANIDGWPPSGRFMTGEFVSSDADESTNPKFMSPPALDRWILSELNLLIERVTESLDSYDVTGAARPIEDFVDDLSNWYVRRSRRRFWKSENDEDKAAAYLTLYKCLVTVAKLLAPFMPFLAEGMYRNLVCSVDEDAPESVHLCDWPVADESLIDRALVDDTRLVMHLVSLGRAARNRAGIKLRQPLSEALFMLRGEKEALALRRLSDQVLEELNVKALTFLEDETQVVDYLVSPIPAILGKKYGAFFPKIREAVAELDQAYLARHVEAGEEVELKVNGQVVTLLPEELKVSTDAKEGYALARGNGYLVAIATALTPDLIKEGLARELVRRIQNMRKEADFRIEDRIVTYYYAAGQALREVLTDLERGDYIKSETLSKRLIEAQPPAEAYAKEFEIEGEEITLGVVRSPSP